VAGLYGVLLKLCQKDTLRAQYIYSEKAGGSEKLGHAFEFTFER